MDYCDLAIAAEIGLLDPGRVILGGGVVEIDGFPMERLISRIRENLRAPNPKESLNIVRANGDERAGVVGAAINAAFKLGFQESFDNVTTGF